ncbi:MAG: hypothetical protein HY698_21565 [Deltaproteobacteria bacterium]|nr:hypothetical protein [Deltaproteobacteria bacterium]
MRAWPLVLTAVEELARGVASARAAKAAAGAKVAMTAVIAAGTVALATLATACAGTERSGVPPTEGTLEWAAPAVDVGDACADVGSLRVCWGCGSGACASPRPLPKRPAPADGWRCQGRGPNRTCVDRRMGAGRFLCEGDTCLQRHPRLPGDGVWECVDQDGVVVCRSASTAAGVVPALPDPGWTCGRRRGDAKNARICVDLAPDLPNGATSGFRCKFDHARGLRRLCTRDPASPKVGGPCPCPEGVSCVSGRCIPAKPAADCWLPKDCGPGMTCRHGTCETTAGSRQSTAASHQTHGTEP